jgi:hypothetical protein
MTDVLTAVHRTMLETDSGIAAAVIAERGYRSLTMTEAVKLLPTLRFSTLQSRLGSGLLFPLTLPDDPAPLYQFRPDHPRRDDDGQLIRYEIPHKTPQRLIVHPRAMAALASGTTPVYITEGAKKYDSLVSRGATPVGGIGVWNFTIKRTAAEKKRGAPKVLLPDWGLVRLEGRQVIIVFDSDAALNEDVDAAEQDLAGLLRATGARVDRVRLPAAPDGTKQGVDDYFARGASLADLAALVEPLPRQRFATISAPDLYHKTMAPARWVIPGKLPVGATLFYGRSKDGKSFMVWNLAMATATGGKALGAYEVEHGDVLYLALEDGERRGQERLCSQMLHAGMTEPPPRLDLKFWTAPRLDDGFLECLETWVDEHPDGRLVIIDILEKIRPTRTRDGVYADDYRALEALQQFGQRHNIGILIVHHSNKGNPEDFRDSASGSMGLTGACDTLWSLHRMAGAPDATLKLMSREFDKHELALQFQDGFWSVLGDAQEYRLSKESQEVLDALTQAGKPLTPKQLATSLATAVGTIRVRLKRMLARGEVLNYGDGYLPRSSPPPPPPPPPLEREEACERKGVTPVTPVTGVMGVTPVTLDQKGPEGPPKSVTGRYRGVTGGGVTLFAPLTHGKDETYSNGMASVTGVTPPVYAPHHVSPDMPGTPVISNDCAEKQAPRAPGTLAKTTGVPPDIHRPPQPCPGCQQSTTWVIRGATYVCARCERVVPHNARRTLMAGKQCDLCQSAPCGGYLVILRDPHRHIPASAWGKVCWTCWRRIGSQVPGSPQLPTAWQQWVESIPPERRT